MLGSRAARHEGGGRRYRGRGAQQALAGSGAEEGGGRGPVQGDRYPDWCVVVLALTERARSGGAPSP